MTFEQLCKSDNQLECDAWVAICELIRRDRQDGKDRAFEAWWRLADGIPDEPARQLKEVMASLHCEAIAALEAIPNE